MGIGSLYLDNNISPFTLCNFANVSYRSTELKVLFIQYMIHDYLREGAYFINS